MSFWIISTAIALVTAALLWLAAARAGRNSAPEAAAEYDLQVYRDQLREVERDAARGVIAEADAERARNEIARRILAADQRRQAASGGAAGPARKAPALVAGLVIAALLAGGSLALYARLGAPGYGDLPLSARIAAAKEARETRPSQAEAVASLPPSPGIVTPDGQYGDLVRKLRAAVAERPDDLQGHRLLARNEAVLGDFQAAARAQARVLDLLGDSATAGDFADYGDMLILAAGGYVSPEAEAALRAALARDPGNGPARYYMGAMMAQTGRPDVAFRIWEQLLRDGPANAPWIAPVRAQIPEIAMLAGVDFTLPPEPGAEAPLAGPSAGDMAAAADMTEEERQQMIRGMVEGLSERLATEGGSAAEWARLIGALGVLGETDRARAIRDEALQVFAADPASLAQITQAAGRAGLDE